MAESQSEFLKRKKAEKREQAVKYVIKSYNECEDFYTEDELGEQQWFKALMIDGQLIKWRIRMEPEIEELYSTIDISKALGMPRERLRDWMVRGYVKPSLPSTSKGTIAIFTRDDVLCVALFQKLIDLGFKREAAKEYIEKLRNSRVIPLIRFIALKHKVENGERNIDSELHVDDGALNLSIASNGNIEGGPFSPLDCSEWEGIHIINIMCIDRELGESLAKIG